LIIEGTSISLDFEKDEVTITPPDNARVVIRTRSTSDGERLSDTVIIKRPYAPGDEL
jgi:hypothetical protein